MHMKNTKILASTILVSILGFSSINYVSADDFDCSSIDRETMKEVMEKSKNGETLSSSEEELMENAKECKPEGKEGMQG